MPLLIRTQQHWLPRLIDIVLTIAAWVGFVGLIYIGIKDMLGWVPADLRLSLSGRLIDTLYTLLFYVAGGALVGAALLIWAKYNELRAGGYERRERASHIGTEALSASFRVSVAVVEFVQSRQVWILHNHEHGDLSAIEIPGIGVVLPADADYEWGLQAFVDGPGCSLELTS